MKPEADAPLDAALVQALVQETVGRWATITEQWLVVQDVQRDVLIYDNGLTEALGLSHGKFPSLAVLRDRIPEPERDRVLKLQQVFLETVEHCKPCRQGTDCILALTHRHRRSDGSFGRLQRHVLPLVWSSTGRVRALLHLCREVAHLHGLPGAGGWNLSGPEALREDFVARLKETGSDPWTPSSRERELLLMVAQGLTSQAIAARLHLSVHTVNTHRRNLLRKAGLPNTAALVERALQQGWMQDENTHF
jgi:DNA-binding CsgD family transcriptional regulator